MAYGLTPLYMFADPSALVLFPKQLVTVKGGVALPVT